MTARKCKVCGVRPVLVRGDWCNACADAFERVWHDLDTRTVAEWGAKRRADAARKGGGK